MFHTKPYGAPHSGDIVYHVNSVYPDRSGTVITVDRGSFSIMWWDGSTKWYSVADHRDILQETEY